MTRFLHTADWQLGKPFAGVEDSHKRALLLNERIDVLRRIGQLSRDHGAQFIVVAGDLFDSPQPTPAAVAAACGAIGQLGVPVYAIPGNHDHGGGGSLWEQDFFRRQSAELAPNLRVLLDRQPVEVPGAVLFPCPLLQRHEPVDPTFWLRALPVGGSWDPALPRVVLAHGSVLNFGSFSDDEDADGESQNQIDLTRLPPEAFDYVALGDWHGSKLVSRAAWYSGTPEHDRFLKGGDHDPGNVLLVDVERGRAPSVQKLRTSAIGWNELEWEFTDDASLGLLLGRVDELVGQRVNRDLLRVRLRGALGLEAFARLEQALESWEARLIRLRVENEVELAPSASELDTLTRRAGDPLVARVAARLSALTAGTGEAAQVARQALRELHLSCLPH